MPPYKQRPQRGDRKFRQQDRKPAPRADQTNPADWQRQYDRYCALARDAMGGDEVSRELYWQHAEHYRRLMNGSASYV